MVRLILEVGGGLILFFLDDLDIDSFW